MRELRREVQPPTPPPEGHTNSPPPRPTMIQHMHQALVARHPSWRLYLPGPYPKHPLSPDPTKLNLGFVIRDDKFELLLH